MAETEAENAFFLEEMTVDEDDPMVYEEVPEDLSESEEEEDFSSVLTNVRKERARQTESKLDDSKSRDSSVREKKTSSLDKTAGLSSSAGSPGSGKGSKPAPKVMTDDFIRNFLAQHNLTRSLDAFQAEWHENKHKGLIKSETVGTVDDVYVRNQQLEEEVKALQAQVQKSVSAADKAKGTWDKFRKERDFHRMHHRRVAQEKNKLLTDMKRLKTHYAKYQPMLLTLRKKYEGAAKEKMLILLEKEKLQSRLALLESELKTYQNAGMDKSGETKEAKGTDKNLTATQSSSKSKDSAMPADDRINPHLQMKYPPVTLEKFRAAKTFKGHNMSISGCALHPTKPILATVSDDRSWKLWALPKGELIMSGDGHKDWIGACDFHPSGGFLATASGDSTVKLWDLKQARCAATLTDHTHAVWDVTFHDSGDFFATASLDHTARLWDFNSRRCRQTFRGHVDSVNAVVFQPFSNTVCTASGDKTVSMWDIRSGLCIQTFFGHQNAVNQVQFNLKGDTIASCDADGVVKIWDIRTVSEKAHINTGSLRHPVNDLQFDRSGTRLAVGNDVGVIHVFNVEDGKHLADLEGHEDAIQGLVIDKNGEFMVSCASDCTFRVWSN